MYLALARKLRFLEQPHLAILHNNPTFNRPATEMMDELHILEPPPRKVLVAEVKRKDARLLKRLEQSRQVARKVEASMVIFRSTMRWYQKIRLRRNINAALESAMRKESELSQFFVGDDGSIGSYGTGSMDEEASLLSLVDAM